jgi:Putative zinc-finger
MTEVPKIVYDRLRAALTLPYGLPGQAHPDADLLTAFAERSLSATERDGVVHHLASCGDCREVVALALPAPEIAALPMSPGTEAREPQSSAERQARWTTGKLASMTPVWMKFGALNLGSKSGSKSGSGSGLRWAALAAGVVVAASVLALYPGKSSRPVATNTRPANAQIASSNPPDSTAAPSPATSIETAKSGEGQRPAGLQRSASPKSGEIAADRRLDASTRRSANFPAVRPPEVTSEISTASTLMARNEAPAIEKAKPALQIPEAQLANSNDRKDDQNQNNVQPGNELKKQLQERDTTSTSTSAPSALASTRTMSAAKMAPAVDGLVQRDAHWTITGGALLRSPDGGRSWQDSLRPSHPLLCYANHGEDIWAGGQAGTLFHSTNSGATWVQVQPSSNRQQLSSDITLIDLQSDLAATAKIAISTAGKEMWISADGGKTWEKK